MTKKGYLFAALGLCIGLTAFFLLAGPRRVCRKIVPIPQVPVRVQGRGFEIRRDDAWHPFEIRGVNMGSTVPGAFPNEGAIDEETYFRWFEMLGRMNANTLRIYQLHPPEFYTALCRYNAGAEQPLYLIQTVDLPERMMFSHGNLLEPEVHGPLFEETDQLVRALHGDLVRTRGDRLEIYSSDASPYVIGYLLGIEWDELFVDFVCRLNADLPPYEGQYLSAAPSATPFESFLARWGDHLLSLEMDLYRHQKMITFCNWPDTDPFRNELSARTNTDQRNEPDLEVMVDTEHILPSDAFHAGIFASYNVYPYYPLFLQYGPYTYETDSQGRSNPYLVYLRTLVDYHSVPVLISEYGAPSSRAMAHDDVWQGRTHGRLSEQQQAQVLLSLYRDIRQAGCAGSLLFSWQDEWYKRTWNEELISDPDGRAFWSNPESAEQCFGLLAFEPGDGSVQRYPDGDLGEWTEEHRIASRDGLQLSMQSDEKYVYFLVEGFDPEVGATIALDTLPEAGLTRHRGQEFGSGADFLLQFSPNAGGRLLVHDDYSLLLHSMSDKLHTGSIPESVLRLQKQHPDHWISMKPSPHFHVVQRAGGSILSYLHQTLDIHDSGDLTPGNGNPSAPDYNSNADYFLSGSSLEIRIPWLLLNFRDPSRRLIVDGLERNDYAIVSLEIPCIHAAVYGAPGEGPLRFHPFALTGWDTPLWQERLKPAYYALQEEFKGVN